MSSLQIKTLILDNVYTDRFLFVAFVKYLFSYIYSYCIQNCTFRYFLEIVETFISWRKYFQRLVIFTGFFIQKPVTSITQKLLVVESCPTPQWITFLMFYRLVYKNLSFKRPDFCLKCLVTVTPKVQSLKFMANVWMKRASYSSLLELDYNNWVIIIEQKRKTECSWACTGTFWTI